MIRRCLYVLCAVVCAIVNTHADDNTASTENSDSRLTKIDNFTPYAPTALTFGLKAVGVEGRSDWGRFLASGALSYAAMAGTVEIVKSTAHRTRPDGSEDNSFPSGHTASAFAAATILHKEYGTTRSPWFSVGGYACATATGMLRVLNNRHWPSDVIAGAGIGVLSTELAYTICDLIFKDKGLRRHVPQCDDTNNPIINPTFLSIDIGISFGNDEITFTPKQLPTPLSINLKPSMTAGLSGAYFFNRNFGAGGAVRMRSTPITDYANPSIAADRLIEYGASAGIYFNLPIAKHFALGAYALTGRSLVDDAKIGISPNIASISCTDFHVRNADQITISGKEGATCGAGISVSYAYTPKCAWRLFADYDYAQKDFTLKFGAADSHPAVTSATHLHHFTLGGAFSMAF